MNTFSVQNDCGKLFDITFERTYDVLSIHIINVIKTNTRCFDYNSVVRNIKIDESIN